MALFYPGLPCSICGKPILEGQNKVMFSPFVSNEADPLFPFNDGVFHSECFQNHPLAHAAKTRYAEVRDKSKPENRRCPVCRQMITDPDDYLPIGHLTDDVSHPLYRFNY